MHCPALIIAGSATNQGKTTVTAALARHHRRHGRCVRVFKIGPDFLDPMILECASGHPVHQLDLWMVGEAQSRRLLYEAAGEADLILIEGVMGLFDGQPSSADLAEKLQIPIMVVMDASGMAETFGAIAHGLTHYRSSVPIAGVFANRVGSQGHYHMLIESLPDDVQCLGWMQRDPTMTLPSRHLGLVQANEIEQLDVRIDQAADALNDLSQELPGPVEFPKPKPLGLKPCLAGIRVGVARDSAFTFLYPANLDTLQQLGAELVYFSPLNDPELPLVDALYLAGGYPELHLSELSANHAMIRSIRAHHRAGKSILAECGGMLYLLEILTDSDGNQAPMVGLIPGHAHMQQQLSNLGLHLAALPEGELRGHTFHHSQMTSTLLPITHSKAARHHGKPEPIYREAGLTASYLHFYFASNPAAIAQLFKSSLPASGTDQLST